ncbi:hypothetical protein [Motiliproteus sp. MSK22-1]|uniref:hypothetical protein n=1 Tax=Motiliproteus sp. MSK22-1 TaxID=1897630 RepID=UPI000975A097|nr:hypothetical protein [Motiliproteus sp. MSK22-1]OMH39054.1 hypothetical protein BGP75_04890 [Motiliproteus sp. MSK22-1]
MIPKANTKMALSSSPTPIEGSRILNARRSRWKKQTNSICLPAAVMTALLLISGCSGHPGTGIWEAKSTNPSGYWMLKVQYDGTATVLAKNQEEPLLGCFWQATAADIMKMQCATANDPENPDTYQLSITTDQATFSKEGKQLALFQRKP